ncbi:MAG: DUF1016 N-terminal domain-containing protein [Methylococcus sp.]|nr:DUF1016 N-terminal domain-containing protein [Methylococcus sp.]
MDKKRAGYGEQLIARQSPDLTSRFGRRLGVNNLENMRRLFLAYPRSLIFQKLSEKSSLSELAPAFTLPWSAYVRLLSVKNDHARRFYETESRCGARLEDFLLELGEGAAFIERQRRLCIDQAWYRMDLLYAVLSSLTALPGHYRLEARQSDPRRCGSHAPVLQLHQGALGLSR